MVDDPVIRRVRDVRHVISEQHGHDPVRLVEYYRHRQEEHKDRLRRDREEIDKTDETEPNAKRVVGI